MQQAKFLCAIDLPDTLLLSRQSEPRIEGWIIPSEGASINAVLVEINGQPAVRTTYPVSRPDVKAYYPHFADAESSGFATPVLTLEHGKAKRLDIKVIARSQGADHAVHRRRIRLLWLDSENDVFRLGQVGPFAFPEEFDEARLKSFPESAPAFVLSTSAQAAGFASEARTALGDGSVFLQLLKALVECHDVFMRFRKDYFSKVGDDFDKYAVSRFDVYEVMNGLIDEFHQRLVGSGASGPAFVLAGKEHWVLVPLLARLYPKARFAQVRPGLLARAADFVTVSTRSIREGGSANGQRDTRYEDAWAGRRLAKLLDIVDNLPGGEIEPVAASGLREWLGARGPSLPSPSGGARTDSAQSDPLAPLEPHADTPIFVLGAGRSGTSAMVGAMRAAGIDGFHEGHLFPMLDAMLARLAAGMDAGELCDRALSIVARTSLRQVYGEASEPRTWLDKTPDHPMIDCVPLLHKLYPGARYIVMRRHPVSFAESRRRKFKEPLLSAIGEWVKCIDTWKTQRALVPASQYIECDAGELKNAEVQKRLADFLQLEGPARKNFIDYLLSQRPEFTRVHKDVLCAFDGMPDARLFEVRRIFFEMLEYLGEYLDDMPWSAEQKAEVTRLLAGRAEEHGYSLNRPENHLAHLLAAWAMNIEKYGYASQYREIPLWEDGAG